MTLTALGIAEEKGRAARLNRPLDPTQTGFEAEKLDLDLRKRIVGQDEAIQQVVNTYQTNLAGMSIPGRPIGSFLFLGPTGSGKTRMVEATAESLVGDTRAVIKIDCAEFQHSHEIAKLIGSPPGYLGHRETHPLLSQEALNQYHTEKMKLSFVLFDEIEKSSEALWNLLLGILDKATLTLGDNRRVDFSRALIFMTSNLGAARCKFAPEFMNRLDKTVVFRPLGEPELRKILALELGILQHRIFAFAKSAPFVFSLTAAAKEHLLREGTDMKYGARHLKRAIDRSLVHPLSNLMASEQVRGGDLIRVDLDEAVSRLTFFKDAEDMPAYTMVQMVDWSIAPALRSYSAGTVTEMPRPANASPTSAHFLVQIGCLGASARRRVCVFNPGTQNGRK